MNSIEQIIKKLDNNKSIAYSLIRVFLGVALFVRGWFLISDPAAIIEIAGENKLHMWYSYIAVAHLIGGILMTIGFFTRLGALIQIPILFAAAFIVHAKGGLMMGGQSLELAALVLFLLIIVFIFGSGSLTVAKIFGEKGEEVVTG